MGEERKRRTTGVTSKKKKAMEQLDASWKALSSENPKKKRKDRYERGHERGREEEGQLEFLSKKIDLKRMTEFGKE
jgi:hypothetical protein